MRSNVHHLGARDRRLIDMTEGDMLELLRSAKAEIAAAVAAELRGGARSAESLLTTAELAAELRIHPDTIRRWAKANPPCPAERVGRDYRWRLSEVLAWQREAMG